VDDAPKIKQGAVVYSFVREPKFGRVLPDPHYSVVLSPQHEIDIGQDLRVAVISTNCRPLQPGWFDMDAAPGGHEITGLFEACAVKATWLDKVNQADVIRVQGRCRASTFKQLQNWLAEKSRQALRAQTESDP
jgi:hypothetical protein